MQILEAVGIALESLRVNRLRSALTLLGVVIGVMTVITVISFISGLNAFIAEEVFNLGGDVFIVSRTPDIVIDPEDWNTIRRRRNLLTEDANAVRETCAACLSVGARLTARAQVKYGREFMSSTEIRGITPEVPEVLAENLSAGRHVTEHDVRHSRLVAVVGAEVVDNLFPFVDPVGKILSIDGRKFEVVGVGERRGTLMGRSQDVWAAIPITAFQRIWGARGSVRIYAKADGEESIETAADEARAILRARRHVSYGAEDDFTISTNETFLTLWSNISRTFFAVTIAIASISLLVGGIVVMNIMLVSVTERTREIGIRMASGARRGDILRQFLIESATLSLLGGVAGVCLSVVITTLVSSLTGLPSVIEWWAVLLGLAVSTGVGLFFGIWPAMKAAELDPIAALRYE